MNDLIEFLTSKEIIVVYVVAGIACLLCFIVYLIDKSYYKRKQKQNTRELNKIIEDVKEVTKEETKEETPIYESPILEPIIAEEKKAAAPVVVPMTIEEKAVPKVVEPVVTEAVAQKVEVVEQPKTTPEIKQEVAPKVEELNIDAMPEPVIPVVEQKEELVYTDVEPDKETAQKELMKLTEELKKQEEEIQNIDLTYYEEEQEENAIISLEELVKKSKEMYESNEVTQYADEGNEPISLQDLELRMQEQKLAPVTEEFNIESVVEEPEIIKQVPITEELVLDDFNSIKLDTVEEKQESVATKPAYQTSSKFQSSPVISPIFGIERTIKQQNDMELENTANYEKLDEEIKKTNEFLMTLRELQKHLD